MLLKTRYDYYICFIKLLWSNWTNSWNDCFWTTKGRPLLDSIYSAINFCENTSCTAKTLPPKSLHNTKWNICSWLLWTCKHAGHTPAWETDNLLKYSEGRFYRDSSESRDTLGQELYLGGLWVRKKKRKETNLQVNVGTQVIILIQMPSGQASPYPPWPTSYWLLLPYLFTLIYLLLGIQSRASCVVDKHFTTELWTNRRAGFHVFLTHVVFEHTWFWDPLEPRWFKRMNSLGFVVMAHWLRMYTAPAEDVGSVLST